MRGGCIAPPSLGVVLGVLGCALPMGCSLVRVDYVPGRAAALAPREPRAAGDVEVYTYGPPDWDYEVVGYFQEETADSVPGGRPVLALLLREMGAQAGCDAVIVGGKVSRFEGGYEDVSRSRSGPDGRRSERTRRPVFRYYGTRAACVVRREPIAPSGRAEGSDTRTPREFFWF
jgi:hypothetical protein